MVLNLDNFNKFCIERCFLHRIMHIFALNDTNVGTTIATNVKILLKVA